MHNTIKFATAGILCVLCACSSESGMKINTEDISSETEKYSINCESVSVDEKTEGLKSLNEYFSSELSDWQEDFISRAEKITVPGSAKPCLQVRHSTKLNNGKLLSVMTEKYVYLNGLHGNTWVSAKNFDVAADKLLLLSDLFTDGTYPQILEERIERIIENDPETYHDLWEKPDIDHVREDRFYLDGNNLVIFYEPYELSYYARGVVEFPIPTEKIRGYIKPEYLPSE